MCGGTARLRGAAEAEEGLSPRVRRHLCVCAEAVAQHGSISACAEAPQSYLAIYLLNGVYLRVCGGTKSSPESCLRAQGLSPRVRRHLSGGGSRSSICRSISACAEAP